MIDGPYALGLLFIGILPKFTNNGPENSENMSIEVESRLFIVESVTFSFEASIPNSCTKQRKEHGKYL